MTNSDFSTRFQLLITSIEGSNKGPKARFAERTNKSRAQISDWCLGKGKPTSDYLEMLCLQEKVNINWLIAGKGPMFLSYGSFEDKKVHVQDEATIYNNAPIKINVYAPIVVDGNPFDEQAIIDQFSFNQQWSKAFETELSNLIITYAIGEGLFPYIKPNDWLVCDQSETKVKESAVYLFVIDDEICAKKVQYSVKGDIRIIYDNPEFDEERVLSSDIHSLNVVGKVLWKGTKI